MLFSLTLSRREREFCSTLDREPVLSEAEGSSIVRLSRRRSPTIETTHEPGRVTEMWIEGDTQPCSAGKNGSVLLISPSAMICQVRFRQFRVPSSGLTRNPKLKLETADCCQTQGKRCASTDERTAAKGHTEIQQNFRDFIGWGLRKNAGV
jgi:hypothetical protein